MILLKSTSIIFWRICWQHWTRMLIPIWNLLGLFGLHLPLSRIIKLNGFWYIQVVWYIELLFVTNDYTLVVHFVAFWFPLMSSSWDEITENICALSFHWLPMVELRRFWSKFLAIPWKWADLSIICHNKLQRCSNMQQNWYEILFFVTIISYPLIQVFHSALIYVSSGTLTCNERERERERESRFCDLCFVCWDGYFGSILELFTHILSTFSYYFRWIGSIFGSCGRSVGREG